LSSPSEDPPHPLLRTRHALGRPGSYVPCQLRSPADRAFAPGLFDGSRERRIRRGASGDVLDGAHGLAVHREHQQLHHRLPHRLCGAVRLPDRLPRRTRVGSRRLGGEAFIRRADSVAAVSGCLIRPTCGGGGRAYRRPLPYAFEPSAEMTSFTMHVSGSFGSGEMENPSSLHIASIAVFSASTWPSMIPRPSVRAYSMIICMSR